MDKIFIGGTKEGRFHKSEQTDVTLFITGDDIAKITNHAKSGGAGTFKNKEGKTVVKLRIATGKSGKIYCEIDTFEPKQGEVRQDTGEDLPF